MKQVRDYDNSEVLNLINERIHSARDRDILCARFIDGLTYEKLAENFDMSVTQIKRIVYKGQDRIF